MDLKVLLKKLGGERQTVKKARGDCMQAGQEEWSKDDRKKDDGWQTVLWAGKVRRQKPTGWKDGWKEGWKASWKEGKKARPTIFRVSSKRQRKAKNQESFLFGLAFFSLSFPDVLSVFRGWETLVFVSKLSLLWTTEQFELWLYCSLCVLYLFLFFSSSSQKLCSRLILLLDDKLAHIGL